MQYAQDIRTKNYIRRNMSGTKEGGLKASLKNTQRHGADYYKVIGAKGGKVRNPRKGFGADIERAREAGRKGGTISRRV